MNYLSRGYASLRGPGGGEQSPTETIDKLCDRLLNGQQLEERRAALLGLKGMSRDWKSDVGKRALPILLGVLEEDAPEDLEMAKAVVETLSVLCEVEEVEGRPVRDDSGLRNTDVFLSTATPLHILLSLLTPTHFYLRFFSLQLLGVLLANRAPQVQGHVLTAPGGIGRLVETLDDGREIIRNEALLLIIALTSSNADIQKLLAFEGAFDKLFQIVRQEGGIGAGGIVVQDCLAAIAGLLRWNVSNQNYFRETSCVPSLAPLLLFPRTPEVTRQALANFAFQSWSEQKVINAGLVISIIRMLVSGAGSGRAANQKALLNSGVTRCLLELALASNAPAVVKSQSINAVADIMRSSKENQELLSNLIVTPLLPPEVRDPAARGRRGPDEEEYDSRWHSGEPNHAVAVTIALAVNGDGTPGRDGLKVRAGAANLFESYVTGNTAAIQNLLEGMKKPIPEVPEGAAPPPPTASAMLVRAMRVFPHASVNEPLDSYGPFFACLLFSHLLLNATANKTAALDIRFAGDDVPEEDLDEDERVSLVIVLVGNLMMAQREQAQSVNAGAGPERSFEWSRIMIGYLIVLSLWLWECPLAVREFLSEGNNIQVLIQPMTQSTGVDSVVQGLCAMLLGICYEYNREPGDITRETLHPILQSRVGPDQFATRILRLREDPRFRTVTPNVLEMVEEEEHVEELGEVAGLWFDYAFVDFLKTNYLAVQRAILLDPEASEARRSMDGESSELVAQLRMTVMTQGRDLDEARARIATLERERDDEVSKLQQEIATLNEQVSALGSDLAEARGQRVDVEKEQEDLLVLLEELSARHRADKDRMRAANLPVSDDEGDDDEEG